MTSNARKSFVLVGVREGMEARDPAGPSWLTSPGESVTDTSLPVKYEDDEEFDYQDYDDSPPVDVHSDHDLVDQADMAQLPSPRASFESRAMLREVRTTKYANDSVRNYSVAYYRSAHAGGDGTMVDFPQGADAQKMSSSSYRGQGIPSRPESAVYSGRHRVG